MADAAAEEPPAEAGGEAPAAEEEAPASEGEDASEAGGAEAAGLRTRFALPGLEGAPEEQLVRLEELLRFIFPADLQHPLSTGRLYAFGFYGPLDRHAQLRSGRRGTHVVSRWELDAMCAQFEREDVLQVYILPGRPLGALSEAQQDELIAQADRRIKAQTGRGLMPQLSRADVAELLEDVPRAPDGAMRFHDAQEAIAAFREARVAKLKVMYPRVARRAPAPRPRGNSVASRASRRGRGRARVSPDVAPPEMFLKDTGMTNNLISKHTNRLLSTRAYKICDIEAGNSFELTANVRLIRESRPARHVGDPWDTVSKRPTHQRAKLKLLCDLRDHRRALEPARPWEPSRAV